MTQVTDIWNMHVFLFHQTVLRFPLTSRRVDAGGNMALYKSSLFQQAVVIESKPGALEEERTRTTMDTNRELTMEARERSRKAPSH